MSVELTYDGRITDLPTPDRFCGCGKQRRVLRWKRQWVGGGTVLSPIYDLTCPDSHDVTVTGPGLLPQQALSGPTSEPPWVEVSPRKVECQACGIVLDGDKEARWFHAFMATSPMDDSPNGLNIHGAEVPAWTDGATPWCAQHWPPYQAS